MTLLRSIINDAATKNIPFSVHLELTRKCNLKCLHCYATQENRKELSTKEIKNLIDELRAMGTLYITFSGGEPTCRKDFLDILRYTSQRKISIQLSTNGVLINKSFVKELSKLNLFHVGISIYGPNRITHDLITGVAGSFDKTVNAGRFLKDAGIYTVFKFIMMKYNQQQYAKMKKLANRLGIPYRVDTTITPRDNLSYDNRYLQIKKNNIKNIYIDLFKTSAPVGRKKREDLADLSCLMGRTLCSINAYGDVRPCVQVPISAGNIRERTFTDVWLKSPFLKEIRKYPDKRKMHGCPECELRPYCYRCPGNAYMEMGDIYGPSPQLCINAGIWKEIIDAGSSKIISKV
jgi:radical SAM protein with 4Fe4S-binding SPASM domain